MDPDNHVSQFTFSMHEDTVEFVRSTYTIWDYFGDLGGLNDFMKIVGSIVMSLYTYVVGSGFDRYLVENLFYKEQMESGKNKRKPAKFKSFLCLQAKSRRNLFAKATHRINNELDVVNFVRHQLIDKIHRKLIFSKNERFLMKHQAKPFVLRNSD